MNNKLESFADKLSIAQPCLKVIEYNNCKNIIIFSGYGLHRCNASDLLKGNKPTIMSALNKTSYFINKSKNIHKDKYNYNDSVYKSSSTKIIISCPIHGKFLQSPAQHLKGMGCSKCGREIFKFKMSMSQIEFLNKCKSIHGNLYDYSEVNYLNNKNKVNIICSKHGVFDQLPDKHLNGHGCIKCGYEKTPGVYSGLVKNNPNYATGLYILEFKAKDGSETFSKVGLTNNLKNRLKGFKRALYDITIVDYIKGTAGELEPIETELKNYFKELGINYTPNIRFEGYTECYKW